MMAPRTRRSMGRLLVLGALLLAGSVAAGASLPGFDDVRLAWRPSEARLLDRHGTLLHELRVDHRTRRGDWLAAGRAALSNWLNERPRGASTVSMQLVALLDTRHRAAEGRRAVAEKWRQMEAARELERRGRKADMLETYLNLVPLRGELVGIDAAARGLFDKRPSGLDGVEALIIAALIRAPNARPADVARRVCAQAADLPNRPDGPRLRERTLNALSGRYPIVPAASQAPHLAQRLLTAASPRPHAARHHPARWHARAGVVPA